MRGRLSFPGLLLHLRRCLHALVNRGVPLGRQPQGLQSHHDLPDEDRRTSGLCAFCFTPSEALDSVWLLCPTCTADQQAWENDFTLQGTCTECGTPQVGLNSGGLCHPCVHDFDFDGTCHGCGAQRQDLNRWNVCRSCAHDIEHQIFPHEPAVLHEDGLRASIVP